MSKTIKVLSGGGFVTQETRSETMCELREEMSIDSNASAAVGGVNVRNSYQLQDGDIIAFVNNDKTGGLYEVTDEIFNQYIQSIISA